MIQLVNVSKSYGSRVLFQDITWQVDGHRRVGLTGSNGTGKSTLLKILSREITPDSGELRTSKDTTIGYLPQEVGHLEGDNALDVVLRGREDLLLLEKEIRALEEQMSTVEDVELLNALASEHGEKQNCYEQGGGYSLRARAEEVLHAMGFEDRHLTASPETFSGGWRMKMLLSRLLLQSPDLLLLDEPTNHLDIESMRWLEGFLNNYPGTIVMVSHDRRFLNATISAVASVGNETLRLYPGNYDSFVKQLALEKELLGKQAAKQAKEIEHAEAFIRRFGAKASKAKQAQSRAKALAKMKRIVVPDAERTLSFKFPPSPRCSHLTVDLRHIAKRYGDNVVYEDLEFRAYRGDRIALVGPNGAGKSTLLKIIAGAIEADSGDRLLGDRVTIGYFAQHQAESLDLEKTVLEEILATKGVNSMTQARGAMGAFLFDNDSVDKQVKVLSGGEKNRLALAKLLLNPPNVLVMDEPTNHLDLESRDSLQKAMQGYDGCLIFITHDRYFINQLVTKVFHIEDKTATEYIGNFNDYLAKRKADLEGEEDTRGKGPSGKVAKKAISGQVSTGNKKERRRQLSEIRDRRKKATRILKKEVTRLETLVGKIEEEVATLEGKLADPKTYSDGTNIQELSKKCAQTTNKLETLMEEWEAAEERLDAADAEFAAEIEALGA